MTEVKEQHTTNKTARKKLFNTTNIDKHNATKQLTFIEKVVKNSDDQLHTNIITGRCNHKIISRGILHI